MHSQNSRPQLLYCHNYGTDPSHFPHLGAWHPNHFLLCLEQKMKPRALSARKAWLSFDVSQKTLTMKIENPRSLTIALCALVALASATVSLDAQTLPITNGLQLW